MKTEHLAKCSRRRCGWIGTDAEMVMRKDTPQISTAVCPRCGCDSFYDAKPGEVARPTVVTLCGSTRFVGQFNEWRQRLAYQGIIVLSIEIVTTQAKHEDPQHANAPLKAMLDELHLRKIDLSDEILVLNVGGYIGESTAREIAYAQSKRKKVRYLEQPSPAPVS